MTKAATRSPWATLKTSRRQNRYCGSVFLSFSSSHFVLGQCGCKRKWNVSKEGTNLICFAEKINPSLEIECFTADWNKKEKTPPPFWVQNIKKLVQLRRQKVFQFKNLETSTDLPHLHIREDLIRHPNWWSSTCSTDSYPWLALHFQTQLNY